MKLNFQNGPFVYMTNTDKHGIIFFGTIMEYKVPKDTTSDIILIHIKKHTPEAFDCVDVICLKRVLPQKQALYKNDIK